MKNIILSFQFTIIYHEGHNVVIMKSWASVVLEWRISIYS